ncbi:DUF484 family protein [Aestuariispira ectoiniformans]|uniref:DUF484 family protein n=1 Tax=Aestuariispira ectoiniformans TaxID=2775080 RepID=UPI00223C1F9D|nr:DUF484 family protein [Aestuariispira ectoiniformans]
MNQGNAEQGFPEDLTDAQVKAYLRAHPDFLVRHADLFRTLTPPARELGDGITDLQQAMIDYLREQVSKTEDLAQLLIDNSRDNLTSQTQIHECVLGLLAAASFEELIETVTTDLAVYLNLDVAALCIEAEDGLGLEIDGLRSVSPGTVDALVPEEHPVDLRGEINGSPEIFGGAAPLIESQALVRLNIAPNTPAALLAFGSRDPQRFNATQATELLQFLGHALAELIRIWLALPTGDDEEE